MAIERSIRNIEACKNESSDYDAILNNLPHAIKCRYLD